MKAEKVTRIFIHCTAGFGSIDAIKRYWKSLGWKSPGYHRIVNLQGDVSKLSSFDKPTNGVKYYNSRSIHIAYIGGVDFDNYNIAKDTRTDNQKKGIYNALHQAITWLDENGKDLCYNLEILGHRDISPDKNLNGRVDPWERIKECPSFDAVEEYKYVIDNYILGFPLNSKP